MGDRQGGAFAYSQGFEDISSDTIFDCSLHGSSRNFEG